ncbi:HCLS1-associated protein X-1 isoform X1 [Pezoporus wallicus]|uniref:HCLS1-associated protein X-1 isoform X1 n=1 Tax=Pezoporus wallicus TaxID=35540 RepID=UPI00254F2437|nr:HCLS1-associated protein X-1 isoform X1 [Pezoporus wallicus]XP_057254619.1 HCLS1-associated protein X-1 isoform X1 [Pezoporus wallicus]
MSFYDAFRGFFGFPGPRRPRDPLFGGATWDEDEDDEDGPSLAQPPPHFGFGPRGAFEELFRDVGELLGLFGGAWAGLPLPSGEQEERLPPPEPAMPSSGEGRRLRDSMLKHPESLAQPWSPFLGLDDASPSSPSLKADQDLDSQVSSAGLGTILRPGEPKAHSYFQSVSVTKVTLPDGAVEECRTVQDSQGRRETTVTRRRGDQAFITTTKEDGQSKDYREEVVKTDDRELAQFAGTWPPEDSLHPPNLSDPSSALGSFFRRWFSSW